MFLFMKSLSLLVSVLLFTANSFSQELNVIINPADRFDAISKPDIPTRSQTPVINDGEPYTNMYRYNRPNIPTLYTNHIIIIRFLETTVGANNAVISRLKKVGEIDPTMKVKVRIGSVEKIITPKPEERNMTDFNIFLEENFDPATDGVRHNDPISVIVEFTNATYAADKINNPSYTGRYFISNWNLYQAFGAETAGFWMPSVLFSSNLRSTEDGVPFASLPIGLAWGAKYTSQKGRYVGFSVMANWLIYTQPENSTIDTSTSFNLGGLTYGLAVDINDVITLGYAYGNNFRKGYSDPGHMFVLGFGSKALNFLKKDKPEK